MYGEQAATVPSLERKHDYGQQPVVLFNLLSFLSALTFQTDNLLILPTQINSPRGAVCFQRISNLKKLIHMNKLNRFK